MTRNYYLQIQAQRQGYKAAFIDAALWIVLTKTLGSLLKKDWDERLRSEMAAKKQHLLDLKATFDFSLRPGKQFKSPYRDLNLPASASLGSLFVEKTQFPLNLMQVSPELW